MEFLAGLFVGKPLQIAVVAAAFLAGYIGLRAPSSGALRHPRMLLVAAVAWAAYAVWEWLVQTRSPEANIRVDLLVIWPVLGLLSVWAIYRAVR